MTTSQHGTAGTPTAPEGSPARIRRRGTPDTILVHTATALIVVITAVACTVRFQAISAYTVTLGALPRQLSWSAPLLLDALTTAGALTALWLERTRPHRLRPVDRWYARALIAGGSTTSLVLSTANTPSTLAARLVATIPSVVPLLAAFLLLTIARGRQHPAPIHPGRTVRAPRPHPAHARVGPRTPHTPSAHGSAHIGPGPAPPHPTPSTVRSPTPGSLRARVYSAVLVRELHGDQQLTAASLAADLNANVGTVRNALRAARRAYGMRPPTTRS